jgi:hypothetical protein
VNINHSSENLYEKHRDLPPSNQAQSRLWESTQDVDLRNLREPHRYLMFSFPILSCTAELNLPHISCHILHQLFTFHLPATYPNVSFLNLSLL